MAILGWENWDARIIALYIDEKMSSVEIAEMIYRETGIKFSPRSLQRVIRAHGESRSQENAFRNAMERGRVVWQLAEDAERRRKTKRMSRGMRYRVLQRDNFTCVLCGISAEGGGLLQVDHIVALVNGGNDSLGNLRTLCVSCNVGKREAEKEGTFGGGFVSGGRNGF